MRVLIADDHYLFRDALKQLVAKLDHAVEVLECGCYSDALALAAQDGGVDLAVIDLRMPDMNGTASIGDFCGRFPETRTVILSGYYRRRDVVESFRAGAAGFVPKTLNSEALLNALRLVLAGGQYIPEDLLPDGPGGSGTETGAHDRGRDSVSSRLTARERETLAILSRGLSNKSIAKELGIEESTVKLHLRKIYQKMGARNRAHAVALARDHGLDFD